MDSSKSKAKGKSLRARSKEILGASFKGLGARLSTEQAQSNINSSGLNPEPLPLEAFDDVASSSTVLSVPGISTREPAQVGGDAHVPEFLTRSPDPDWIDIEMMGCWLEKCDKEHGEQCRRPFGLTASGFGRTSLLIDVRKKCLVDSKASHRYACLSYVWGGASTLKTVTNNLNSLMQENALEARRDEIPRTIRDTIDLVDQLGIRYLWVDSLCIVQDDLESKHDQIQAMAGIYANAYVTIIAGNGWDANHGLRGIQGVTEPRQLSTFLKSDFEESLQPYSSIWYSRGWTFQEMIFSPRKIMFQYQLAIWECNKASWHESSLSSIPTPLSVSSYRTNISPWKSQILTSSLPNVKEYIALVQDYTRRELTYSDDVLPAITSLLSVMCSSFSGGFIGGLPQMFFDEALLWQPEEPMQRRQAPPGRENPPSWSWAGWQGEIMKESWEDHFCYLHVHRNGFGNLSSGGLLLQVTPTVYWFYGHTLEERIAIRPSGRLYIKHLTDHSLPVPSMWSSLGPSHGSTNYVFDNDLTFPVAYPLPIPFGEPSTLASPRYLFCRTSRGYFKGTPGFDAISGSRGLQLFSTILRDRNDLLVGSLNLNLGTADFSRARESTVYELVEVSAGTMLCKKDWALESSSRSNQSFIGWGNFYRPRTYVEYIGSEVVEFYYVLCIEWENGIAYRKGLGRILKDAWDNEATEAIDLILG